MVVPWLRFSQPRWRQFDLSLAHSCGHRPDYYPDSRQTRALSQLLVWIRAMLVSRFNSLRKPSMIARVDMVRALSGSFLEEQFPGAECSFDHRLDEGDTQLPFFEFEDAVNRAAGRRRYRVFQQRWMVSGLQHHAR